MVQENRYFRATHYRRNENLILSSLTEYHEYPITLQVELLVVIDGRHNKIKPQATIFLQKRFKHAEESSHSLTEEKNVVKISVLL